MSECVHTRHQDIKTVLSVVQKPEKINNEPPIVILSENLRLIIGFFMFFESSWEGGLDGTLIHHNSQ